MWEDSETQWTEGPCRGAVLPPPHTFEDEPSISFLPVCWGGKKTMRTQNSLYLCAFGGGLIYLARDYTDFIQEKNATESSLSK